MSPDKTFPPVRHAMGTAPLRAEILARPALELLIGLYATMTPDEQREASWAPPDTAAAPPETRAAMNRIGADAGEVWLHLLGLALDAGAVAAADIVAALEAAPAEELRRYLVGVYVPAWSHLIGQDTLERAAAGDATATRTLLEHPRYYGGRAAASLAKLLPLDAEETKMHLTDALRSFAAEVFAPLADELAGRLAEEARRKEDAATSLTVEELIDAAARGYHYEREPELERVLLVPHYAARPWLLLCQHRAARVICYGAHDDATDPEQATAARLLAIGRAISDEKRLTILLRLRQGDATLQELSDTTGLARSTTHHHLGALRRARLIALRGNASGYAYTLDPVGFTDAERLLRDLRAG